MTDLLREVDAELDHAVVALVLFARRPATTNPHDQTKSPTEKRIFIELMTSDRKLKAFREGSQ